MKIITSISRPLGNLFILGLSAFVFASAFSFDSALHGLHHNIERRSLPGSFALAPTDAVGKYQPPPGPVVDGPSPAVVSSPSTPEDTDANETTYESNRAMAATDGSEDSNEPNHLRVPSVSEMDAMIAKSQTGLGSKNVAESLASIVVSIFVALLYL